MKKRLICLLLCLCLIIPTALASCGDTDDGKLTDSDSYADSNQKDSEEDSDSETSAPIINYEAKGKLILSAEALGFEAKLVRSDDNQIAMATLDEDGAIKITTYNAGSACVTVANSYGETVKIAVTVGKNYNIEKLEYNAFEKPRDYVIATDFGMSPFKEDNTEALQNAINSLVFGGVVYIPAGIYKIKCIQLKENVDLRLEGVLSEYNTKYTSTLDNRIASGKEFAVLQAIGGDMFLNNEKRGWGRDGTGDFTISGGVIDMMGTSRAFVWSCADNITLENIIMRDCPNDHAIQVGSCRDVRIRNVMFAGYNLKTGVTGSECIQIEMTHPGAMGAVENTPSQFDTNEGWTTENVVIESCYFGKSEKFDAPTYAVGHHGQQHGPSAKGVYIYNCTFDNPRISAVRTYGWEDVEISGCTFISDKDNSPVPTETRYMIELSYNTGVVLLPDGSYLCVAADRGGCSNINIHDNVFKIGRYSKMGGIITSTVLGQISYDAIAYAGIKVTDFYTKNPSDFTGYKLMTSRASDISFCNNDITIENEKGSYIYRFMNTKGLAISDNKVTTDREYTSGKLGEESILGGSFTSCVDAQKYAKQFTVQGNSANTSAPIVLNGAEKEVNVFCSKGSATNIIFKAEEGGEVGRRADADGTLYVEPIAADGYAFDGYYVLGKKIDVERYEFDTLTTVELKFVKQ